MTASAAKVARVHESGAISRFITQQTNLGSYLEASKTMRHQTNLCDACECRVYDTAKMSEAVSSTVGSRAWKIALLSGEDYIPFPVNVGANSLKKGVGEMPKEVLVCATTALIVALSAASVFAQSGAADYTANCAGCHGADGKSYVAAMRSVPGYRPVDLTVLSKRNGGVFPRQAVTDAIEGRHRFAAHFRGDMPRWGAQFQFGNGDDATVKRRISALVDYVESLQEKSDGSANQ